MCVCVCEEGEVEEMGSGNPSTRPVRVKPPRIESPNKDVDERVMTGNISNANESHVSSDMCWLVL